MDGLTTTDSRQTPTANDSPGTAFVCILSVAVVVLASCATTSSSNPSEDPRDHLVNDYSAPGSGQVGPNGKHHTLRGKASWYGGKFHGRQTASGETYDMYEYTAAHKTLPFHTVVRVTDLRSLKSVVVRINDRGPFVDGRIIDLSKAAARDIGLTIHGVRPVKLEILRWGDGTRLHANL